MHAEIYGSITLYPSHVPTWAPEYLCRAIPAEGRDFTVIVDSSVNGGGTRLIAGEGLDVICISQCVEEWIGADHPAIIEGRARTEMALEAQRRDGRDLAIMLRDERRMFSTHGGVR